MLPGFRFLLTAIMLSLSILVFGLGAAALLRAAHEEFASNPSWHAAPETSFAQQGETTREAAGPVLALLRVDTPAVETPKIETPSADVPAASAGPPEQAAISSAPAEPQKVAALINSEKVEALVIDSARDFSHLPSVQHLARVAPMYQTYAINACADLAERMGARYYGLYDLSREEIATAVTNQLRKRG